ncbi:hypothetical protein Bpfe_022223 [Biomphalaria pfeifferi]|uniref:Uncharacterized protein n=1 Tax=Biomphalaria pfeifferi TaxID=112525 RepID=A0AAD8B589_BIOPF|nr:hypothetical protein Bpfe_022223 [Biomphalaria pfeifferi]
MPLGTRLYKDVDINIQAYLLSSLTSDLPDFKTRNKNNISHRNESITERTKLQLDRVNTMIVGPAGQKDETLDLRSCNLAKIKTKEITFSEPKQNKRNTFPEQNLKKSYVQGLQKLKETPEPKETKKKHGQGLQKLKEKCDKTKFNKYIRTHFY